MADYGVKVSKPGKPVTSTEPRDFTLNSDYNILKVHSETEGSVTLNTANSNEATVTINHSLGYKPIVYGYFKNKDGDWRMFGYRYRNDSSLANFYDLSVIFQRTTTTVVLKFKHGFYLNFPIGIVYPADETIYYKVYILVDPEKDAWYG